MEKVDIGDETQLSAIERTLKALVWFWWIDETLSANLVYQSDYEIGSTFQVMKQMKIMMWWWHGNDQVLGLGKEEREKNELKVKVKSIGPFCFGDQDT